MGLTLRWREGAGQEGRSRAAVAALALTVALATIAFGVSEPPAGAPPDSSLVFTALPADPQAAPTATLIQVPRLPGAFAIWGSIGRDNRGHIWFGVATHGKGEPTAYLVEYVPETGEIINRGDALSELKRLGLYRQGEQQCKIHTRIVQGSDGNLYFASQDEQGADYQAGTRPPTWGSHLWRLRLPENRWEHLLAVPEGLIALAAVGRDVYALGYFNHKLYHYDIAAGETRSVLVGSLDAHISRNIICDWRGHVYVPRLRSAEETGETLATLVEFDADLRELRQTPLRNYVDKTPNNTHGIIAFQPMADRSIIIVTSLGYLYRIVPEKANPAKVVSVGWLHPDGPRYAASLFTCSGKDDILGLTIANKDQEYNRAYEWVARDLGSGKAAVHPFKTDGADAARAGGWLLYGSVTRDNEGRFYVVGTHYADGRPIVLQVQPAP